MVRKKAFDLVKEGKNVYLTGLAGTGKSYIVERIIEWAQTSGLNVITCAPTGIAALNVGGSTVHRVLCIRPGRTLEKDPHPFVPTDSPLPDCDLLILDEVSMCRMDLFDYLSTALRILLALVMRTPLFGFFLMASPNCLGVMPRCFILLADSLSSSTMEHE